MKTDNYQIGIEININHINAVLVFQQNKQWKINAFWQFPLPLNDNIDDINLRTIFKTMATISTANQPCCTGITRYIGKLSYHCFI